MVHLNHYLLHLLLHRWLLDLVARNLIALVIFDFLEPHLHLLNVLLDYEGCFLDLNYLLEAFRKIVLVSKYPLFNVSQLGINLGEASDDWLNMTSDSLNARHLLG